MPTLHGWIPDRGTAPERTCIWCQAPTDITFTPEAMLELGPQPMHLTCGMDLLLTYGAFRAGRSLKAGRMERLARLQRLALTTSG